jgi:hypothetical protein
MMLVMYPMIILMDMRIWDILPSFSYFESVVHTWNYEHKSELVALLDSTLET